MKSLITATASLMVLLAFLVQFSHSQLQYTRLTSAQQSVRVFHETVKQEGCITEDSEKKLKDDLCRIFSCKAEEVLVDGERTPVFRGTIISYQVQAPVSGAVAMAGFWGLKEEENRFEYKVNRSVTSEYTGREQ